MTLLVTPPAYPDENYPGYFLRLANENGFAGIRPMLRLLGIPNRLTDFAAMPAAEVAERLGIASSLIPTRPNVVGLTRQRASSNPRSVVNDGWSDNFAWCPVCLRERAYWRAAWDSPLGIACGAHRLLLRHTCIACGRRPSHERQLLERCSCGADFHSELGEAAAPVDLAFSNLARLHDGSASPLLRDLSRLSHYDQRYALGWIATCLLKVRRRKGRAQIDVASLLRGSSAGDHFLAHPDDAVEEAVCRVMRAGGWGELASEVQLERLPRGLSERLAALFHLSKRRPGCRDNVFGFDPESVVTHRGYARISDLSRQFAGSKLQWANALNDGLIIGLDRSGRRGPSTWRIPLEAWDELKHVFRASLSLQEAAGRMRISPAQVRSLVRLKVLSPVFLANALHLERYWPHDVDAVVEMLFAISQTSSSDSVLLRPLVTAQPAGGWTGLIARVLCGEELLFAISNNEQCGLAALAVVSRTGRPRGVRDTRPRIRRRRA